MKGDFSRDTFTPRKHYSGVLMQQGRVQLDADWNEQRAIDRHRIETEARSLTGPGGGPANNAGFEIGVSEDGETLIIGPGDYYVDGTLCQNEDEGGVAFEDQEDLPGQRVIDVLEGDPVVGLAYLDVWEQHVTALDDDHIREVALGGPDTATRTRTVWQAKVLQLDVATSDDAELQSLLEDHVGTADEVELARTNNRILELLGVDCDGPFDDELRAANPPSTGELLARALPPASAASPCVLPPNAGYERLENQLYRVEIHRGGARDSTTFKWSRDNGSVATAVLSVTPTGTPTEPRTEIVVRDLGRDETLGFANGQYVELVNDDMELSGQVVRIVRIASVNPATRTITVNATFPESIDKLRRWDSAGDLPIPSEEFVDLEGGIQVRFLEGRYNTGDYWLIPARTATGEIEWPEDQTRPPAGIEHHYSPLALVMAATVNDRRRLLVLSDCRRVFPHVTELTSLFYLGGDGQEAGAGRTLPRPLVVGVANGDRPVVGAQVKFEVQTDDPSYDGYLHLKPTVEPDGGTTDRSVTTTTDARGEARCFWTVATEGLSQQVESSLLDGTHLSVYFNAKVSPPGEAVEESIRIERLLLGQRPQSRQQEQDLRLDGRVPVTTLAEGIRVVCDENSTIDERTVEGKPTCFVTLEMPFPQVPQDKEYWGEAVVGFQPLILDAEVTARGNVIFWNPSEATGTWLETTLFDRVESDEILAHLTLKGNFIRDRVRPRTYLDGDVFGLQEGGRGDAELEESQSELELPSGDRRRGGDFEMWFRLVPQSLILDSVVLDQTEVTGGT